MNKWINLWINDISVHVSHYLLERSRVVVRNATDLNFHIFYYLFAGLEQSQLLKYFLVKPESHRFVNIEQKLLCIRIYI